MQSFLQSKAWEEFQQAAGATVLRHEDALYIQRSLPFGGSYWQVSRATFKEFSLPEAAKNAWFVRIEPQDDAYYAALQNYAKKHGLKLESTFAVQPRQTSIVDLTPDYDEIIQNMNKKHRYNIRLTEKHQTQAEVFSTNLPEPFERFWKLLQTTSERHDFRTHPKEYYVQMLKTLETYGMAHILLAAHQGEDLAGMILITHEDTATYLHGGSTPHHREMMAPYALHATAMRFAKEYGCKHYDLWGTHLVKEADGWHTIPNHPSAGTSRFKLGFNGNIIEYPGTYDLVLKPFWYTLYKIARKRLTASRDFA